MTYHVRFTSHGGTYTVRQNFAGPRPFASAEDAWLYAQAMLERGGVSAVTIVKAEE